MQSVSGLLLTLVLSKAASTLPMVAFRVEIEPDPALQSLVSRGLVGNKPEKGGLLIDNFFLEVMARDDFRVISRGWSDGVANELPQPGFLRNSDPALAEFAAGSYALYGVHVLVSLYPAEDDSTFHVLRLKARVVRRDGKRVVSEKEQSARIQTVTRSALLTEFKTLTRKLVSELALGALPAILPASPSPSPVVSSKLGHADEPDEDANPNQVTALPLQPSVTEGQRVVMVSPPPDPGAGQRLWGKVGLGVGVGAAVIGAVVWSLGASDFARVKLAPDGLVASREDAETARAGATKRTTGIVLVTGGAAIAAVGAGLWALAPKPPGSSITIGAAPLQSGIVFSLGGTFN
jgi:hypothetical protein